jgi:hypothetical protein
MRISTGDGAFLFLKVNSNGFRKHMPYATDFNISHSKMLKSLGGVFLIYTL